MIYNAVSVQSSDEANTVNEAWLKRKYWTEKKSLKEVASETNVSYQTIYRLMKKWNIPRRCTSEANRVKISSNPLTEAQKNRLRNLGKGKKIQIPREELFQLYFEEKNSTTAIAKIYHCSPVTISARMKEFGFAIRTASERKRGKLNPSWGKQGKESPRWGKQHSLSTKKILSEKNSGKNSSRWKPPEERKATLHGQIRATNQMKNWRLNIFKRDNFTCVLCSMRRSTDVQINADHIVPLALILKTNNIQTVEQAVACTDLWQHSNGRTLCVPCHGKTKTWGSGTKTLLEENAK